MDITLIVLFRCFWILPVLLLIINWQPAECYYELSAHDHDICSSGARHNASIDLVCRVKDQLSSRGTNCDVTDIKWYRTSSIDTYEITTSTKYDIWESVDGWGLGNGHQRVALLRVKNFDVNDVARYSCHVACDYGTGLKGVIQYHTDVCLEDPNIRGMQCPVVIEQDTCTYNFQNGRCDRICDLRDHLYDGHDCAVELPECANVELCAAKYSDGNCNEQCNTPECQWDGGDCISKALDLAHDAILLKVERPSRNLHQASTQPTHRQESYRILARYLSRISQSLLRLVPVPRTETYLYTHQSDSYSYNAMSYTNLDSQKAFDTVVLKLDNTLCEKRCLRHVDQVVQYLSLANIMDGASEITGLQIHAISVLRNTPQLCKSTNSSMLHLDFPDSKANDPYKTQQIGDSGTNDPGDTDGQYTINVWIIVFCAVAALIIVGLLVAIFIVMVSIRREQKHKKKNNQRIYSQYHKEYNTCKTVEV